MPYLALVAKWPTPTAQPSVHYRLATICWCAQSHQKGLTLAAAFEKSSSRGEDECVYVCLQAKEWVLKEQSCSERGSFCFWHKVWILCQSLSPPSKALVCSPSHAGIWLLPFFLSCWEVPLDFGKENEVLAWGSAPSWAGREDAQVSRVHWTHLPCCYMPYCRAPWLPWEYGHLLGCLNTACCAGKGCHLINCSQQCLSKRCRCCLGER